MAFWRRSTARVYCNGRLISAEALPDGAPNLRHFLNHEFEAYVQDSWRARKNLTITYGLRWTFLQPPYEVNGVQVAPTTSLNRWFNQRAQTQITGLFALQD